jgi:formate C-acetyltransferase
MGKLSRREFIKTTAAVGGVAAASGLVAGGTAAANVPAHQPWLNPWRPECPKLLSDATHELARRAIMGEHGRGMAPAAFALDEVEVAGMSPDMRYAHAVKLVAERAPLRILPGELVVGSATLKEAPAHSTPVAKVSSVSHTTIGFDRVLKTGYKALRQRIQERLRRGDLPEGGEDFLNSMMLCLDAAEIWHGRYMAELDKLIASSTGDEQKNYTRVRDALANVPENPAGNFHEAVQSLWFMYAFQRLLGNWSGIGRIDEMLGPYLERDLAAGRITEDEARELLAHFWIKGCEWIGAFDTRGSGDAQHYQNIVLSGIDASGNDITNDVTYLVLDVVEELHISDFPLGIRVNKRTDGRLLRRVAEVQRHGGGIAALYNEEVVIDGLVKFGYPLEEAREFANDGCWEVLIPGKTAFIYVPFDLLALLQDTLGLNDANAPAPDYADFDSLYAAFMQRLRAHIDRHNAMADNAHNGGNSTPLISLFVEDCIERARGYNNGGAHYRVMAPHAGGMANVANNLLVIDELIYRQHYMALPDLVAVLRADWDGQEPLRRLVQSRFTFYGNDDDKADAMMRRVFDDYTGIVAEVRERNGVLRPCGISTFGREIEWSQPPNGNRKAGADGYRRGAILATNCSPSPGTDKIGPTAVIKSYCKLDFARTPNGATVEIKLHPECAKGEEGLTTMVALMRGFVDLGGWFMHTDVVDSAMLLDAQRHPEKYPNLSVRVAGWSARFATLDKNWQDMVINRTQQYF